MVRWPNFAGGTVLARSPLAADELTINLWPCTIPTPTGKSQRVLYGCPGSVLEADLGTGQPVRGLFDENGRTFAVSGDGFFERSAPGLWVRRGSVALDTRPATLGTNGLNGLQVLIVSGGRGYIFRLDTNAFAAISDADFPPNVIMTGGYLDGYFLIQTAGGTFYISALADGSSWDAADVASRTQGSATWVSLLIATPHVYLWSLRDGEIWYNSGAADFPLAPVPEVFLHVGIAAPFSAALVDGKVCWLGTSREGGRQVFVAQQFQAVPVSDPIAVALERYTHVEDAIGWGEVYDGHPFYVVTFPTEQVTWVYDLKEDAWHQRGFWSQGIFEAQRGRCHCVTEDGTHLVGSRIDGTIYRQSLELYDDAGADLRWLRQPPRIWNEGKRLFHRGLELHTEPGIGGQGVEPAIDLEWSNDGGKTFGSVHPAGLGKDGAYGTRVTWPPLGASRDRVYRFSGSAPIKRAFLEASITVDVGMS